MTADTTDTGSAGNRPLRIGLTGGIASGKTAVSDLFKQLGVPVIDTDVIAREVVMPGQPALQDIAARFGASMIQADGQLDRNKLREIVFSNNELRESLEAILHPRIRQNTLEQADQVDAPYLIIVVPLLFETDFHTLVDRTLVVHTPSEVQKARLISRDGASELLADQIIASQLDTDERISRADDAIENAGSFAELEAKVQQLHNKYLSISA